MTTPANVLTVWVLANPATERVITQTIQGTMLTAPTLGTACTFASAEEADRVKFVHGDLTYGFYAYPVPAALFLGREYRESADYVRVARTRPRRTDDGTVNHIPNFEPGGES